MCVTYKVGPFKFLLLFLDFSSCLFYLFFSFHFLLMYVVPCEV